MWSKRWSTRVKGGGRGPGPRDLEALGVESIDALRELISAAMAWKETCSQLALRVDLRFARRPVKTSNTSPIARSRSGSSGKARWLCT